MGADLERAPHHRVVATLAEYRQADGKLVTHTGRVTVLEDLHCVAIIPEPSTWALLTLGGLAVGWRLRRRLSG